MMKCLKFKIDGKPVAKQSIKFTRSGMRYTPAHIAEYSNWVKLCFKQAYPDFMPDTLTDAPLCASIAVAFEIPKSFAKGKRLAAEHNVIRPIVKPDCDNIAKNILDSLNGLAYSDDKQIVDLKVSKFYGMSAYVTVEIRKGITK